MNQNEDKKPKKKLSQRELIRLALLYAVQDRMSYLDAIRDCDMDEEEEEAREFCRQAEAYRKKKYGKTRLEHAIENASGKPIKEFLGLE